MPLQIQYVSRFAEVVSPAVEFLSRDVDLFAKQRIVVPTAGAKAWLWSELARRLGAGAGRSADGIVANIEIGFPGSITSLLQPGPGHGVDGWSLDRLTFAVVRVITSRTDLGLPSSSAVEPLLAARHIAALFDSYHVRRPGMILRWEQGDPVVCPTASDLIRDGERETPVLEEGDRWQFRVWRAVRELIGTPAPPARMGLDQRPGHEPLLVAGLQSLSLHQLQCLERLGATCDVRVLLVHPSPGLRAVWGRSQPEPAQDPSPLPLRRDPDPEFLDGVDQLLPVWLAGAREMQHLLAWHGIAAESLEPTPAATRPDTLLERMRRTVAEGGEAVAQVHDPRDRSLAIHRCHSLSRQAEVLHDALLQAFEEVEGLQPHDVLIVSPCIEKAAPHLQAVFQRTVSGRDARGGSAAVTLPLVVADRGIRAINEAVDLLVDVLALPGSRCSVDDVLSVAGHPLVRAHLGNDDDTESLWADLIERTQVRWGLDGGHRARRGLDLATSADLHTWKLGLEGMLLGATLPDAAPRPELGGVVPLLDLDPADIPAIAGLARIVDVLRLLEAATASCRPVAEWCDAIEATLVGLCGAECRELSEPLAQVRRLRQAAAGSAAEATPVPFDDVRRLLGSWCDEQPGRQPLRTGAITATSMAPLRGVPFRVVCVIGYDDDAVGVTEAEGDDLVGRQQLVGDVDPRIDERRALLDCLLAAEDRLVIMCNGRSVKNNQPLPLVTPLAELVDYAVRHGARRATLDEPSAIEIGHPRHHLGHKNFVVGGVQEGVVWSHDAHAAEVARVVGVENVTNGAPCAAAVIAAGGTGPAGPGQAPTEKPVIELPLLERMVVDPLRPYLEETLGISIWRQDEEATPATFPLTLESREIRTLTLELLRGLVADAGAEQTWIDAVRHSGRLPFGPHGDRQLDEIVQLARGLCDEAQRKGVPLAGTESREMRIDLPVARVVGFMTGVHEASHQLVVITTGKADSRAPGRPLHVAALQLVAARAAGLDVSRVSVVSRHSDWKPGALTPAGRPVNACQIRTVCLGPEIDAAGRLEDFCRLARDAVAAPCGLFGLAGVPADERETAFNECVGGRNYATQESSYAKRTEALVYGLNPVFRQVFAPMSRELVFLEAFTALLTLQSRGATYTLT